MSHDDFEFEPIRGLPAHLPAGEKLLWQGTPQWKSLAVQAYHVRKVAAYFLLLVLWRVGMGLKNGDPASAIAESCLLLAALGGVAIGVLSLLAYLTARSTVYSITSKRVLLRHGVAVPLTMNIPFKFIDNASLKRTLSDTGDISMTLVRPQRVGYLIGWPHVRPGQFAHPAPSFRALADASEAAAILSSALAADAGTAPIRIEQPAPAVPAGNPQPAAAGTSLVGSPAAASSGRGLHALGAVPPRTA